MLSTNITPIITTTIIIVTSPQPYHPHYNSPKHQSLTRKSFGGGNYDGVGYVDTQGRLLGQVVPIPCSDEEDVMRVGAGVSPQGGGEGVATRQVSYLMNYK